LEEAIEDFGTHDPDTIIGNLGISTRYDEFWIWGYLW